MHTLALITVAGAIFAIGVVALSSHSIVLYLLAFLAMAALITLITQEGRR